MPQIQESKVSSYIFKMKQNILNSLRTDVLPSLYDDKLYYPDKKYDSAKALEFITGSSKQYEYDDHTEIRSNDLLYDKLGNALRNSVIRNMNLLGDMIEKPEYVSSYPSYKMTAAVGIPEYDDYQNVPASKIKPKLIKFSNKIQTDLYHAIIAEIRKISKPTARTNIEKYKKAIANAFENAVSSISEIIDEFAVMILHEITHLAQWKSSKSDTYFPNIGKNAVGKKKSDWGKNPDYVDGFDLDYLADFNEIDGYANQVAAELLIKHKAENKKINVGAIANLAENAFYTKTTTSNPRLKSIFKRFMRTVTNNLQHHNDLIENNK